LLGFAQSDPTDPFLFQGGDKLLSRQAEISRRIESATSLPPATLLKNSYTGNGGPVPAACHPDRRRCRRPFSARRRCHWQDHLLRLHAENKREYLTPFVILGIARHSFQGQEARRKGPNDLRGASHRVFVEVQAQSCRPTTLLGGGRYFFNVSIAARGRIIRFVPFLLRRLGRDARTCFEPGLNGVSVRFQAFRVKLA